LTNVKNNLTSGFGYDKKIGKEEYNMNKKKDIPIPYQKKLNKRIFALLRDAIKDNPNSLGILVGSLHYFHKFLQSNTKLRCPIISLTPENHIYASWRGKGREKFSVHFLPNGNARFIISQSNNIRHWGTVIANTLIKTITSYKIDWIFKKSQIEKGEK